MTLDLEKKPWGFFFKYGKYLEYDLNQNDSIKHFVSEKFSVIEYNFGTWR